MNKSIVLMTLIALFSSVASAQILYLPNGSSGIGTSQNNNVGIDTDSPSAKLDIVRTSNGKSIQLLGANLDLDLLIGHNGSGYGFYWRYKGTQTGNNNDLELWANNQTSTDKKVYTIHQDGNIYFNQKMAVGTMVIPSGYQLAIEGKVRAREVKVDLDTWSDYVFQSDYVLMPIEQLANYIQKNKHLPGFPSENEAIKEGISLGEMNAKLLEKIEELTLHIIQLNERIKELESKLE